MSVTCKEPKLRFKEFSGEWKIERFGKLCQFEQGVQVDVELQYKKPNKNLIKFIRIENYTQNSKDFRFIPIELAKNKSIDENEIAIVRYGATAGFIGRGFNGVLANNLFKLKPDHILLDDEYLYQYLKSYKVFYFFQSEMAGGAMPALSFGIVKSLKFPYPTKKPEQEKIASFLSAVDSRIEQLTKKEQLLREYKKGVMQKIFSQELRFKDDDGSAFPEWEEKKLGELFNFLRGSSLSKSDIILNGKHKCIHYGELFTNYHETIMAIKSKTNLDNGQFSKIGDILMPSSDVTPQGLATASALLENNVLIGGDINILRAKKQIDSIFVSYFLNNNKNEIMKLVTGTTIKHIYNKDVSKLKINLPLLKEQTKIANFLSSIDKKIEKTSKELNLTKEFKKGLLQQIFV